MGLWKKLKQDGKHSPAHGIKRKCHLVIYDAKGKVVKSIPADLSEDQTTATVGKMKVKGFVGKPALRVAMELLIRKIPSYNPESMRITIETAQILPTKSEK